MARCVDSRYGKLLYSYELGLLNDAEAERMERHIMECPACMQQLAEHSEASDLVRHNRSIRDFIKQLDEGDSKGSEAISDRKKSTFRFGHRYILIRSLAAAAILIMVLILRPWDLHFETTQEAVASDTRLTIALFDNLVNPDDTSSVAAIMTNLLVTDLAESHNLQVVSSKHLDDLYRSEKSSGSAETSARIARVTGARWTLSGSIVQLDPKLVVTTRLTEVPTGDIVASHRIEAEEGESIFALVDRLAALTRNDLLVPLDIDEEYDPSVMDITTSSPQAYRHYCEGLEYYSKRYYREAEQSWRMALEYDSTFAMVYYCLAYNIDQTLLDKAIEYAEKASPKERLYIRSLQARSNNDLKLAMSHLTELVKSFPYEVIAWMELGALARISGDDDLAVEYLEKAIEVDPVYKDGFWYLAYLYRIRGEHDKALQVAQRYMDLAPKEPSPYVTMGMILAGSGRLDEAISHLQTAVSMKPDFLEYTTLIVLGKLSVYRMEYARATEYFQKAAIDGNPEIRSNARTCLALVPLYQGKLKESLDILEDGIIADRMELAGPEQLVNRSVKHAVAGYIHLKLSNHERALQMVQQAIDIVQEAYADDEISWRTDLAYVLAASGNIEAAESVAEQLRRHLTDNGSAMDGYWTVLGAIEAGRRDYKAALNWLRQVTDPEWTTFDYKFLLATAYHESGQYSEAVPILKALLRDYSYPSRLNYGLWSVRAHYLLAQSYEQSGRIEDAIGQYGIFLDIWKDADQALQPIVSDARERLALLENRP